MSISSARIPLRSPQSAAAGGGSSFDHYELGREIARGGMGRIVEAWDRRHQRSVAIKMLLRAGDVATRRFAREIEITAHLQHPAIIPLYEAGRTPGGDPFFAMKRVTGRALSDVIAGTPDPAERLRLLPQLIAVSEALGYAHQQGIVHRDLKPANVLIGAFGEAVVIDWGLAKMIVDVDDPSEAEPWDPVREGKVTVTGAALGTPGYMAPEQARGASVDERSDVYALGALLYHVFAGSPPRTGVTPSGVVVRTPEEPVRPLRGAVPQLSPDLAAIVEKAMAHDPAARYANAGALAADLRLFEAGQLVSARAYSLPDRVGRWVVRRRAVVATATVLMAALLVTLVVSVRRIVNERDRADASKRSAEHERALAIEQRDAAEHLVQFTIGDLRDRLEPLGKLDVLAGLGSEVDRYYGALDSSGPPDRQELVRRALALDVLGKVEVKRQDLDVADRLLKQKTTIWERVAAADPRDAEARGELALAIYDQARILGNGRGRYDDSYVLYQRASGIAAEAIALAPEDVRWRIVQAYVDSSVALCLSDRDQARASIVAADHVRDEVKALADDPSMPLRFRTLLAVVHCDLGGMAMREERLIDAAASRGRCAEMREAIVASRPGAVDDLLRLGEVHRGVAYALRLQGRVSGASSELERALSSTRALLDRDHGNLDVQRELGIELAFLADSRGANADPKGAETALREGMSLLRGVATARADNTRASRDVIRALQIEGEMGTTRGDLGAALRAFDEAAAVIDRLKAKLPDASKLQAFTDGFSELWVSKARAEVLGGRLDAARADLDAATAVNTNPDAPDDIFTLARIGLLRGDLARVRGERADAEAAYSLAAERAEASAPRMPQYPEPKKVLAEIRVNLGELRAQRGDREGGRALGAQAVAMLTELDSSGLLEPPRRPLLARAKTLAGLRL